MSGRYAYTIGMNAEVIVDGACVRGWNLCLAVQLASHLLSPVSRSARGMADHLV
jgi:hypothetical protein